MINQQLLGFIKEQLQKGLNKEIISKELLANGWTAQDVEEGFNAISTPTPVSTPNPISNPAPVSNFGSFNSSGSTPSTFMKEKSHPGKKIFLIILLLFLLGGGASAYYFRNDLLKLPIIKDFFPSEMVNVVPTSDVNQDQNLLNQNTIASELAEKDCGISKEVSTLDTGWESTYKDDPVLKCFGESALSCTNSKLTIKGVDFVTGSDSPTIAQIINSNGSCYFKITQSEQKYNQCPLNIVKNIDLKSKFPDIKSQNPDTQYPEKYAAEIFTYGTMGLIVENNGDDSKFKNLGCTGDLFQTMATLLSKAKEKYLTENPPAKEIENILVSFMAKVSEDSNVSLEFGFKDSCKKFAQPFIDELKKQNVGTVRCFDSKDSVAMSASLSTGGFMCFDTNNGLVENMKNNIIGPKCQ